MEIDEWWPRLDSETQKWLIENNGDVVPPAVLKEINRAGGHITSDAPSVGNEERAGLVLSDTVIDWIEQAANDET